MDDKRRQEAGLKISKAKTLDNQYNQKTQALDLYKQGIAFLLQVEKKIAEDFNLLATTYRNMAIIYFNKKEYVLSAQGYAACIKNMLELKPSDNIYRELTESYIDLADACYEQHKKLAGDVAMENALAAFKLISSKSDEELALGDPGSSVEAFKRFHDHFEQKLSTVSYINSQSYINHQQLLAQASIEKQQENYLVSEFGNISISIDANITAMIGLLSVSSSQRFEENSIDANITAMAGPLSVSSSQRFIEVPLNDQPSDKAYRLMAQNLFRIAKSHNGNRDLFNTLKTYKEVLHILQRIKEPDEGDKLTMSKLREDIEHLGNRRTAPSFFPPPPRELQAIKEEEPSNDIEMGV